MSRYNINKIHNMASIASFRSGSFYLECGGQTVRCDDGYARRRGVQPKTRS